MDYIQVTINHLNKICEACPNLNTMQCVKSQCNVGFTLKIMEVMKDASSTMIEDGLSLIPKADTKYYEVNDIAKGIASTCKLCKECNENHTELCSISLARKSLESIFLKEMTDYPGNVFSYIVNISKQNREFADFIMEEYKRFN